ncbi:MAG: hypothetical protein R2911_07800 [Caldilineaceae bacterium]
MPDLDDLFEDLADGIKKRLREQKKRRKASKKSSEKSPQRAPQTLMERLWGLLGNASDRPSGDNLPSAAEDSWPTPTVRNSTLRRYLDQARV